MRKTSGNVREIIERFLSRLGIGLRAKLIIILLIVKVLPLMLLTVIAWRQFNTLGNVLKEIAINDSSDALTDSAVENIERMTTDTAERVPDFLYGRDADILHLAAMEPSEDSYRLFVESSIGRLIEKGEWELAADGKSWVSMNPHEPETDENRSTNSENNDMDGFNYRHPGDFNYITAPLYDEITFIDLNGNEIVKVVSSNSPKVNYPLSPVKRNVSKRENTYVKAETYFDELKKMKPGEVYVSDVIGAYVGSNYIGMYAPVVVEGEAEKRGYDIPFIPEAQAYAGMENPNGQRFEGIVRWATPVADENGVVIGYVTMALNHDHIMEFVDHQTPMNERYVELPSAFEGNYAFIWDYKCRSISHPRHHSIVGFDPETGEPQVPWLETSIYEAWQASGILEWKDFIAKWPTFDEQSRSKKPASQLTQAGLVGLDGRYLNNAPQCTGWMDLTQDGGSGSFYILWSELYKLTTAAAIPYYTGQYAPSEENGFSRRGFGFVAIGAGLEDFERPVKETELKLGEAIKEILRNTTVQFVITIGAIIFFIVFIAIWMASFLTNNITQLIKGMSRFRNGERHFRFDSLVKDEFGTLADSFDDMADNIVGSVNSPLCITDLDLKIIYMNEYGLKLNRKTLEDIVGKQYDSNSIYPIGSKYCPITALKEGHEAEVYYLECSGQYVKGTANYFMGMNGEKIGYIIATTDVTEVVREQMKIEEQRTLLDEIFSASPDLIWYQDVRGRYLAVNPRFSSITGCSADDFIEKTAMEILPSGVAEQFIINDQAAISSLQSIYTEETIVFADGHEEMLDSVRTPILDTNGGLVGLLGFARDVTTRAKMENELRNTQAELELAVSNANRANEHKGEFLARMSHEIRTPMNAIIGITNIVIRKLNELKTDSYTVREIKDHISQIETSSQHLLGLLNDILDITKIEAGKIEISEETVELLKLAETVVGIIKPRCDEKNIKFNTEFDSLSPSSFISDSLRLRQVLINLLGNAVKFTPEMGRIDFHIKQLDKKDGMTLVEFSVRDTGIGISEEISANIFRAFEQGGGRISRKYGGTGLGLAISRRIVQLFGGDIFLDSTVGEGSTFSFSIWLKETESDVADEDVISVVTGKFAGKKALLVDDVDINRMIVMSLLELTEITIDEASDGLEAAKKFEDSPENTYDIIFMDVQMPVMDGYEATMAIRALDRTDAKTIPIVALTANAFKEDIDRALENGMNAHVAKPVEMENLAEVLLKFIRR